MPFLSFRGTDQLTALSRRLHDAPRRLQRELQAGLSAAARPTVQDVRREIRGMSMAQRRTWAPRTGRRAGPGVGRGNSPLRSPIAAAANVSVRANGGGATAEIVLRESQVPARARWLVPYVVGNKTRLRHPFMGNRRYWVQATGDMNKWWPTIRRHMDRFNREVNEAVGRVERSLGG